MGWESGLLPAAGGLTMSVTVNLTGPAPWGFRITGGRDFRKPIIVSKVTEHGKAAAGDLRPGDIIVSINGDNTADMLNVEAQNKIKQSSGRLQLQGKKLTRLHLLGLSLEHSASSAPPCASHSEPAPAGSWGSHRVLHPHFAVRGDSQPASKQRFIL
uniref:PDZ and LIM domain 2 n=1 Tax=Chelonoidis abingdonii TaxID=106734 RepID=A0A8C0IYF4_CHEAB